MGVKLNAANGGGSVELDVPSTVGSDLAVTIPAMAGEIVVKDSSGNVGVGTDNPVQKMHLNSTSVDVRLALTNSVSGATNSDGCQFQYNNSDFYINNNESGFIQLLTSATPRMTVDSSGNVLIGHSTAGMATPLSVAVTAITPSNENAGQASTGVLRIHDKGTADNRFCGLEIRNKNNGDIRILNVDEGASNKASLLVLTDNGTDLLERMKIDSAGRLDTFADSGHAFDIHAGYSGLTPVLTVKSSATHLDDGTITFQVLANGTTQNATGTIGSISSDIKLKENIVDAPSQWDDIKAVKFRKYNLKEETGYETHTQLGVIAQELELTSPGLIYEIADENDLGTTTKGVKTPILTMKALVALQEAMARIETLETKVAALEAK